MDKGWSMLQCFSEGPSKMDGPGRRAIRSGNRSLSMSLPTEVIDNILGLLQSDLVTLKTCARAHPILSQLVERHVYAEISVLDDQNRVVNADKENVLQSSELITILSNCPYIAHYVHNLKIYIIPERALELGEILSMMTKFSELRKVSLVTDGRVCSWQVLPEKFRLAFEDFLRLRSVAELCIGYISGFPLSLLDNSRVLPFKTLALEGCSGASYTGTVAGPPNPSGLVEDLHIGKCNDETLHSITAWVQTRGPSSLRLDDPPDSILIFSNLIAAGSNSLTKLDIGIASGCASLSFHEVLEPKQNPPVRYSSIDPLPFTLSSLSRLKRMAIHAVASFYDTTKFYRYNCNDTWDHRSPCPTITQLVDSPSLKELFLDLDISFYIRASHVPLPSPNFIWSSFIPLAAKCSSLGITLSIQAGFTINGKPVPLHIVSSSISNCSDLAPYVEQGVLFITPKAD